MTRQFPVSTAFRARHTVGRLTRFGKARTGEPVGWAAKYFERCNLWGSWVCKLLYPVLPHYTSSLIFARAFERSLPKSFHLIDNALNIQRSTSEGQASIHQGLNPNFRLRYE
jgi:hypothetical protein